jgi:hypothetical protein
MRKWILVLITTVAIVLVLTYVVVPSTIELDRSFNAKAYQATIYRGLTENNLLKGWIKQADRSDSGRKVYTVNKTEFIFKKAVTDLVYVTLKNGNTTVESYMHIIPLNNDSSRIVWSAALPTSNNPLTRFSMHFKGEQLKKDMGVAIRSFEKYIADEELVYGVKVKGGKVADTLLVTTKTVVNRLPTPEIYYELIGKLKTYIAAHGASETNFPMLNITQLDSNNYETRVALPVNKVIPGNANIDFKRMFPGKILIADVTGGHTAVNNSLQQMNNYLVEHQLMAPAIPFQSLVTDRLREPDSSKWVTRLYFPVY